VKYTTPDIIQKSNLWIQAVQKNPTLSFKNRSRNTTVRVLADGQTH